MGREGEPFAIETALGWSVVGGTDIREEGDHFAFIQKIETREVWPILKSDGEAVTFRCSRSASEEVCEPSAVPRINRREEVQESEM